MRPRRVAVLGAGIMGTCSALFLARRGVAVTLFDAAAAPMSRASRWNEGKIHLGHLYAADRSLATARRVLPGGLCFRRLVEELVEQTIPSDAVAVGDHYLVHRDSVVPAETTGRYLHEVSRLAAETVAEIGESYLSDLGATETRRLTEAELSSLADDGAITAGFRVPECSVDTNWVADRLVAALDAEDRITQVLGTRVAGVRQTGADESWQVVGDPGGGRFDVVVNALWEGRLQVDRSVGLATETGWLHRYRLCLFVRASRDLDVASTVICTGPFGDIKNYNGRNFYLSWYPVGLRDETSAIEPSTPAPLDPAARARFIADTFDGLDRTLSQAKEIAAAADEIEVAGGFVFARGTGRLDDPRSTLHRRDGFGVERHGSYVSVDTGKYSTAPWLAARLATELTAG